MVNKRTNRRRTTTDHARNGKLSAYMYLTDDKVAIDFWFQQPVINFRSDKAWEALLSHLKSTRNKHVTKEYLQSHWINKIDPNLNEICGTACYGREYLGWEENWPVKKKLEILAKRLEMVRVAREAQVGKVLLEEEIEKPLMDPEEDKTVVVIPAKTCTNVVNTWRFRHEPRRGVEGIEDPKLIIEMNKRRVNPEEDRTTSVTNIDELTLTATVTGERGNAGESESGVKKRKCVPDAELPNTDGQIKRKSRTTIDENTQNGPSVAESVNQVHGQLPGSLYILNFVPVLPLAFSTATPGSESCDVPGFKLPIPCFAGKIFYVLKSPGNINDYLNALRHEYMITLHGGLLVKDLVEVTENTIVIASLELNYNREMFHKILGNIYEADILNDWTCRGTLAVISDFDQYVFFPDRTTHDEDRFLSTNSDLNESENDNRIHSASITQTYILQKTNLDVSLSASVNAIQKAHISTDGNHGTLKISGPETEITESCVDAFGSAHITSIEPVSAKSNLISLEPNTNDVLSPEGGTKAVGDGRLENVGAYGNFEHMDVTTLANVSDKGNENTP